MPLMIHFIQNLIQAQCLYLGKMKYVISELYICRTFILYSLIEFYTFGITRNVLILLHILLSFFFFY